MLWESWQLWDKCPCSKAYSLTKSRLRLDPRTAGWAFTFNISNSLSMSACSWNVLLYFDFNARFTFLKNCRSLSFRSLVWLKLFDMQILSILSRSHCKDFDSHVSLRFVGSCLSRHRHPQNKTITTTASNFPLIYFQMSIFTSPRMWENDYYFSFKIIFQVYIYHSGVNGIVTYLL